MTFMFSWSELFSIIGNIVVLLFMLGMIVGLFIYIFDILLNLLKLAMIPFMFIFTVLIWIFNIFIFIFGIILLPIMFFIELLFPKKDKNDSNTHQYKDTNTNYKNNSDNLGNNKQKTNTKQFDQQTNFDELDYYYYVLGLEKGASKEEIKKAYRSKVMQYHPDRNKDDNASLKYQEIVSAYEQLLN